MFSLQFVKKIEINEYAIFSVFRTGTVYQRILWMYNFWMANLNINSAQIRYNLPVDYQVEGRIEDCWEHIPSQLPQQQHHHHTRYTWLHPLDFQRNLKNQTKIFIILKQLQRISMLRSGRSLLTRMREYNFFGNLHWNKFRWICLIHSHEILNSNNSSCWIEIFRPNRSNFVEIIAENIGSI